jgi:hypothetical protein
MCFAASAFSHAPKVEKPCRFGAFVPGATKSCAGSFSGASQPRSCARLTGADSRKALGFRGHGLAQLDSVSDSTRRARDPRAARRTRLEPTLVCGRPLSSPGSSTLPKPSNSTPYFAWKSARHFQNSSELRLWGRAVRVVVELVVAAALARLEPHHARPAGGRGIVHDARERLRDLAEVLALRGATDAPAVGLVPGARLAVHHARVRVRIDAVVVPVEQHDEVVEPEPVGRVLRLVVRTRGVSALTLDREHAHLAGAGVS